MKKSNFKVLLAGLTGAFVVSACAGGMLISASAENTDPVNSLALEYGASVRYVVGDTSKTGIRFSLKMKDTDYATMMGEGSAYSDVTFGVLIAPEYYHDIYAFNEENVFGANAKYYLNDAEEPGKEKIYNLTGVLTEMEDGDAGYVYFNASLIDILGVDDSDVANNIALDFRGVGYVKYTLNGETVYKFVDDDGVLSDTNAYDDDNVRSMATVADAAITANQAKITELDKEGKTEDDQKTIDFLTVQNTTLQGSYLNKVNYTLASRTYSETIDPLTTTTITVPTSVWALKDTYLANKYTLSWTFAGSEVAAGASINMPTLSGTYNLVATATSKTDDTDSQVVYMKTYTVNAPNVNGNPISAQGEFTYDVSTGLYDSRSNSLKQFFVDSVTDGDYVVESLITTTYKDGGMYMPGIIIGTGAYDNYIVLKGQGGSGRLYITVRTSTNEVYTSTECYVSNNVSGADTIGGTTGYTVARVNGTYYVYNKSGVFVCAIDSTGIYPNGSSTVSYESGQSEATMFANLATYYTKGSENIVGIYTNPYTSGATAGYSYDVTVTKGTDAAASYAIGAAQPNNYTTPTVGTLPTYLGNGQWQNTDNNRSISYLLNTVNKGTGDFVLTTTIDCKAKAGTGNKVGVVLGTAKTTRSDKTLADSNARMVFFVDNWTQYTGDCILHIWAERSDGYGELINVTGFKAPIGVANVDSAKITIAKLNNVLYVYDTTDTLVCYIDATAVHLPEGSTNSVTYRTESNTFAYDGGSRDSGWYASNVGYSVFTGAPDLVAGIYTEKYNDESSGTHVFTMSMTRGTTAANNKVNPTA